MKEKEKKPKEKKPASAKKRKKAPQVKPSAKKKVAEKKPVGNAASKKVEPAKSKKKTARAAAQKKGVAEKAEVPLENLVRKTAVKSAQTPKRIVAAKVKEKPKEKTLGEVAAESTASAAPEDVVAAPTEVLPEPVPQEAVPEPAPEPETAPPKELEVEIPITVKGLSVLVGIKPNQLISYLLNKGTLATINQNLGEDIVKAVALEAGFVYKKKVAVKEDYTAHERSEKGLEAHIILRAPVVTFMGHVDHGKTSLLDYIRNTRVVDSEKGGITQHIGASVVTMKGSFVTFLDTPGHEAFTAMRARGANATDVVVLVVAADDGVMPQTKEAIDHARSAGVPIIVAINKCDLPGADIDRAKRQLNEVGLVPEDWGGKTIMVPVSAKTGVGVENLLEMLLLEAELLELKANPKVRARGVVIEGKLTSGEGAVASVLVKNGTLRRGDVVLSGNHYGRIKAMMNDRGERVEEALPSTPVSILGLSGVPMAGDEFFVVKDEKKARTISLIKQNDEREQRLKGMHRVSLEDFYKQAKEGKVKDLMIVLKADVKGSIEAIQSSLEGLSTKDVKVNLVHTGVGTINDSDVLLALASGAVVIGFNVKADARADETAKKEDVEIKIYGIIYEAIADVKAAMEGLLEPFSKEVFVGRAQVRQAFKVTKVGTVAGSFVVKGRIPRGAQAKLMRNKEVIYEGKIANLKRFKDDAREVREGFECGISFSGHNDIKEGDIIEVYQIEKIARRLEARR
ncbi:MAG: translation initiation factor IF-2 [Candidatus Omnitrophota bacterium]